MNTSSEAKLRQIERASFVLRAICTALYIPVVVLAIAATVSILGGWTAHIKIHDQTYVPSELALPARLMLATVVLAAAAVSFKGLGHLRRLLANYARREIFTLDSARHIRQFGVTCVMWGFLKLVMVFLPLMLATQGKRTVNLTIDTILIGLVIIGISWFAEMAAGLREENDLTI